MKYILISFISIICSITLFSQDYTIQVSNAEGGISYYLIANNGNAVSNNGRQTTDLTFTLEYPSDAGVTLGVLNSIQVDNTIPPGTSSFIIKSGAPIVSGANMRQGYQIGNVNGLNMPNLVEGVPFLIGTQLFTATNGQSYQAVVIPLFGQPNVQFEGFDDFTPAISGFAALPITLKSFDAKKHSASSAKLDWTTSKEVNSDYFGIERSIDGSTWDKIARVKAAGDSNLDIAYDYIDDRLPLSRTNGQVFYYRLRMTDLDGAFKYSDVRGVNFDKQALGPISIYPNPTTEIVNIDLSEVVMEDGDVYVSVYDMSGRLVMTKQIIGSGIELIKVDQLPSDAYNFIIRQGEQIHQQRVIKID